MKQEDYLFKTRPAYFFISFCVVTATIFGIIAYKMLTAKWEVSGTDEKTGHIIIAIFAGIFLILGLVCAWCVICLKIFYIAKDELITVWPLLFFRRSIAIASIERISEKDARIDIEKSAFSKDLIKIGETATLQLRNGKIVKISSLEAGDYDTLIKKLHTRMRNGK